MSALEMFKLCPGQGLEYELRRITGSANPVLHLRVLRPDEGASTDLLLTLQTVEGARLNAGRVSIDHGYMGVLREIRRLLSGEAGAPAVLDFELVRTAHSGGADHGMRALSAES